MGENEAIEYRMSGWYARESAAGVSMRAEEGEDAPTRVVGTGAVFGQRSVPLWGFVEVIDRNAFDECDMSGAVCAFNHDYNQVIGRQGVNLELRVDDDGLQYECTPESDDADWQRVLPKLRSRLVYQSSFAFRIAPGGQEWTEDEDGVLVRTIMKIRRLYDVAPVTFPAYPQTSSDVRSAPGMESSLARLAYPDTVPQAQRGLDAAVADLAAYRQRRSSAMEAMERRRAWLESVGA